ncbi:hypothetical protein C8R43DRAFT_1016830 [Mycena crocata]|nr:hypothetical protein C8R43DRAFT_1016830 [Mycena crocata]
MAQAELDDVTLRQDQRFRRSVFLAGLVVLMYDHLLTLGAEVQSIWSPRFKRSTAWFLLFRYFALLSNLVMIACFLGDFSPETCERLSKSENYLAMILELLTGVTLALRVCAMYGFNRRVYMSLAAAAFCTIGLGAWAVVGPETTLRTTLPGCNVLTSRDQAIRWAVAWQAQLVCDILILVLTLWRAYIYQRTVGLGSGSLLIKMARDGAVYFGMICLVRLANIIALYSGDVITAGSLAWFSTTISTAMISRLILNLHDAANNTHPDAISSEHELESIRFRHPERGRRGRRSGVGIGTTSEGYESMYE